MPPHDASLRAVGPRRIVTKRRTKSFGEIGTHGWQSSGEGNERREVGGRGRTKRSQPVSRAASNSGRAAKTLPLHATGPRPLPSEQYSTPPPPKLRHPPRIPPVPTYAELRKWRRLRREVNSTHKARDFGERSASHCMLTERPIFLSEISMR